MASTLKPLPPLPAAQEPVVDPKTGRVNVSWYTWFREFERHLREAESRITTLEGP